MASYNSQLFSLDNNDHQNHHDSDSVHLNLALIKKSRSNESDLTDQKVDDSTTDGSAGESNLSQSSDGIIEAFNSDRPALLSYGSQNEQIEEGDVHIEMPESLLVDNLEEEEGQNNENMFIRPDLQQDNVSEVDSVFGAENAISIDTEYMKDFYGNSYLRKVCAILITFIISTPICLEMLEKRDCFLELIIVLFFCLLYIGLEDVIEYYGPETVAWKKTECLYKALDKAAGIYFLIFMNFRFCEVINGTALLFAPLMIMASTGAYALKSNAPRCIKEFNVIIKLIYSVQACLVVLKLGGWVEYDWVETFFPVLLYSGSWTCYAILVTILLISVTASSLFERGGQGFLGFMKRIVKYTWYILYSGLSVIALGVIVLSLRELNTKDNDNELLRKFIEFAGYYCSFLLGYTVLFYNYLKGFVIEFKETIEFYSGNNLRLNEIPNTYTFESHENTAKIMSFLKISSTYFSQVPNNSKYEDLEAAKPVAKVASQEQEEVLCYICERNSPDAVMMGCGHGGVCCECAVESLRTKNVCMQCRSPVDSLYKIKANEKESNIVQAQEYIRIVPVTLEI